MGRVYRAHDPRLDRQVAIKLLPPETAADHAARERLRLEAMAVAALDHPYICKIFEIGEYDAALCLVMEYVPGDTLERRLKEGRLPLAEALAVAGEVAEALEEAHTRRFLHRDLKPANIMLTPRGHVKVMDFGLAKRVEDLPPPDQATEVTVTQLTMRGTIVGTPDYMSPEQARGLEIDGRSDIFSLGAVFFFMLTGQKPFPAGELPALFHQIQHESPRPLLAEEAPPELAGVVMKALAKERGERYQTCQEMMADLDVIRQAYPLKVRRLAMPVAPAIEPSPSTSSSQPAAAALPIGSTHPTASKPSTEDTVDFAPAFNSDDTVSMTPRTWMRRVADRIDSAVTGRLARFWRPAPPALPRQSGIRKR
jgi:serine/threonine protein kinase